VAVNVQRGDVAMNVLGALLGFLSDFVLDFAEPGSSPD
jgi:hypothetical protein